MARIGAAVAAGLRLALALGGCGSIGGGSSEQRLFSTSPLDLFKSSPKATTGGDTANPAPVIDTDYDCPEVQDPLRRRHAHDRQQAGRGRAERARRALPGQHHRAPRANATSTATP